MFASDLFMTTTPMVLFNPTAEDAIAAVLSAEGDLDLAGERLFGKWDPRDAQRPYAEHPKARLLTLLSTDPRSYHELQRTLRTLVLLQTFGTVQALGTVVKGTLENQELSDLAKLYSNLISAVASLTDDHTTTVNNNTAKIDLTQALMAKLPSDVQEAVRTLMVEQPSLMLNSSSAFAVAVPPVQTGRDNDA